MIKHGVDGSLKYSHKTQQYFSSTIYKEMAFDLNEITMNIYEPTDDFANDMPSEPIGDNDFDIGETFLVPTPSPSIWSYFTRGIRVIYNIINYSTLLNYIFPLIMFGAFILLVMHNKSNKKENKNCDCDECHKARIDHFYKEYEKIDESWKY